MLFRSKPGDEEPAELLAFKGDLRKAEARGACRFVGVPEERIHFLNLPFYETGTVKKNPLGKEDVEIIAKLLREVQPHQVYAAGDLADPHGTHGVCLDAILRAYDVVMDDEYGDKMQAKVLKVNDGDGQVQLTYKRIAIEQSNKKLEEAFNNKEVLTAEVSTVLDGGLSVMLDESKVFIPASLVSDSYERDLTKYAGQEISFVITEFNPRRRRIIGDRKQLLVSRSEERRVGKEC